MTVRAYDIYGLEFDQDQYKAMNFAVQAEMTAMRSANHGPPLSPALPRPPLESPNLREPLASPRRPTSAPQRSAPRQRGFSTPDSPHVSPPSSRAASPSVSS